MNIQTQLTQFTLAQEAAHQAMQSVHMRLNNSAIIIHNVYWKRFRGQPKSRETAWTAFYYKPDALITMTDDSDFPVTIKHDGTDYRIPRVFVFGSTWEIAKATRQYGYRDRYETWYTEARRLSININQAEGILEDKVSKIQKKAERDIKDLKRTQDRQFSQDQDTLALRKRQMENMKQYLTPQP